MFFSYVVLCDGCCFGVKIDAKRFMATMMGT